MRLSSSEELTRSIVTPIHIAGPIYVAFEGWGLGTSALAGRGSDKVMERHPGTGVDAYNHLYGELHDLRP